jgi:hypothetical protein
LMMIVKMEMIRMSQVSNSMDRPAALRNVDISQ